MLGSEHRAEHAEGPAPPPDVGVRATPSTSVDRARRRSSERRTERALLRALECLAPARDAREACARLVERGIGERRVAQCVLTALDGGALVVLGSAEAPVREHRTPLHARSTLTDAAQWEALVEMSDESELVSRYGPAHAGDPLVAVPLRTGPRDIVGVLGLRFGSRQALEPEERALLLSLGARIGPMMERFRAAAHELAIARELEASNRWLHGVAHVLREVADAGLDERAIMDATARALADVFGDPCSVRALRRHDLECPLETVAAYPEATLHEPLDHFDSAVENAARASLASGQSVVIKRLRHRVEGGLPLQKSIPRVSLMCAPIRHDASAFGVLVMVRERDGAPYTEEDRALLEEVSRRVGRSISAARALAEHVAARRQAEQAAKARERVLSAVSHDLRAPLATVHLGTSLLAEMDSDQEAFADIVGRIGRATVRMRRLVEDLLDLGQLESGAFRVRRRPVSLHRVIEETADELRPRARAAQKELACALPAEAIEVLGDAERLQQVLVNLLANAIDHTPPATAIMIGAEHLGDRAYVWVEDDGPGLDPDLVDHLFEPFVRGSRARAPGSGLGLWIARGLVEAHGGELTVHSEPGHGTRFELSLPLSSSS